MSPHLPVSELFAGQESCEGAFERVWAAAHGVGSITIVAALAVEAQVVRRRDKERLQQLSVTDVVDFGGHVQHSPHHGHCATETQDPKKKHDGEFKLISQFKNALQSEILRKIAKVNIYFHDQIICFSAQKKKFVWKREGWSV